MMNNFYQRVYELVAQIPAGRVMTYGQIAALLGKPSAARAVGYALHGLPPGMHLPWQRVINAQGRISARGAGDLRHEPALQRLLLEAEGVEESGLDRLIKASYKLLGLATFFTAGGKETRAWTFKQGMKAPQVAGVIHSDFERGFIRAETVSFEDLDKYGSMQGVREAGRLRLEGKDYVVQDGDIIEFRFNV